MPLPAPYAPPWKRLGEDLVATLAWLRLKLREWARRNGEGTLPVPGFWPRRWPQLFWPLVLVIALALSIAVVGIVRHWQPDGVQGPERQTSRDSPQEMNSPAASPRLESPAPAEPVASPQAPSPEQIGESAAEEQIEERPIPTDGDQKSEQPPQQAPEEEDDPLLAEWSGADPEGLLEAIRPDPANATLTLQPSGTFLALSPANRLGQAERWQARATDWGYSHLELVDGAGRLVGREAQVGEGMILFEAADAAGSPPTDGEVGERDGVFGNRAGGTGGALGSAPDARPRRWAGLLGRQRRGKEPAAHGGVHRQPPAAAR